MLTTWCDSPAPDGSNGSGGNGLLSGEPYMRRESELSLDVHAARRTPDMLER
jgi:hypothetical protein